LKGYQWPFDTRKLDGSSRVDLLVAKEIKRGRSVFLDFTKNPKGLEGGFDTLGNEAREYLERSGATFGTPIERLEKMNPGAIELYRSHGIDLYNRYLKIAVCAQHSNGGITVDEHWQTEVKGLYSAGEAAGTFGVYRPGGSALNSTQVGSLRAAEHIAKNPRKERDVPEFCAPCIKFSDSSVKKIRCELQSEMSRVADFDRSSEGMQTLFERVSRLCDNFFNEVTIADRSELAELFKLYDMVLTQRSVLSAMLHSAKTVGTHGSALVDGAPTTDETQRTTRTVTRGAESHSEKVSPMPTPELWFETLLARNFKREDASI
jgi:succinate dehydrogenase/fumarate reductase flavoprotein subunit